MSADQREQLVDLGVGTARVGARMAPGVRGRLDPGEAGVHPAEQVAQPLRLDLAEFGALAVSAVDPGEQRVTVAADRGDRVPVLVRERRGGRYTQSDQAPCRPVLPHDDPRIGRIRGNVLLEEENTPGSGDPPALVEQALGDWIAGQRGTRMLVAAQQSGQRGRPLCRALHAAQRRSPKGRDHAEWRRVVATW